MLHFSDNDMVDFSGPAIGYTYFQHPNPAGKVKHKTGGWVFFWQGKPMDHDMILLEFPKDAKVRAGTHSMLYFVMDLKSGDWVKTYVLDKDDLAKKIGYKPYLGPMTKTDASPLLFGPNTWWPDLRDPLVGSGTGDFDEIRISNVARSDKEIMAYFKKSKPFAYDKSTLGLWHLDEKSGPVAQEVKHKDLFLRECLPKTGKPIKDGRFGYARHLENSGLATMKTDRIDFRKLKGWSIELWVRFKEGQVGSGIFDVPPVQSVISLMGPPGAGDERRLGRLVINGWYGKVRNKGLQSKARIANGKWRYIAVTYQRGGKNKIYIDGVLDSEIEALGL